MTEAAINLPFPVSVNGMYCNVYGRGRVKTAPYKDWQNEAGWMLNQQNTPRFRDRVEIELFLTPPDKRRRDIDNLFKCILDLLKTHKIIVDDSSEYVRKISAEWAESENPCIVKVREAA